MSNYFSLHTHSHFSTLDAMSSVKDMVGRASDLGQSAMGLTDHGNMSGAFQLYKACKEHSMLPFPGLEAYIVHDIADLKAKRYHLTMLARTTEGYQTMVKLTSLSHQRDHYHFKPRLDFNDLAAVAESGRADGLVVLTGCHFGLAVQALLSGGEDECESTIRTLAAWFPHTYVELQHHDIVDGNGMSDDEKVKFLDTTASKLGLPVVATQDCHYCDDKHAGLHTFMKQMAYGSVEGEGDEFPGSSYHMADADFVKAHYSKKVWARCEEGYADILANHALSIPPLDTYSYHVPKVARGPMKVRGMKGVRITVTSQGRLRRRSQDALSHLSANVYQGGKWTKAKGRLYEEHLDEELAVIEKLDFADYFLLVADYCTWMRSEGIFFNVRGSANNSLVCWLMGITDLDPIHWELDFDRFLTLDRERPPDIDIDVEDARRDDVINYAKSKYEVIQIGTYGKMGIDEETGRGNLFVSYLGSRRRAYDKDEFKKRFGSVKGANDLPKITQKKLSLLGDLTIYKSPGAHAAGFAFGAEDHAIRDWIPTMLIPSSETTVTQMMMDDVEDAGYIKADFLGLRNLTTISLCLKLLGKDDWHWIPLNDKAVFSLLREGRTETGIFTFEGYAQARGCRQVKVKSIHDLIVVNAIYRPATMQAGHVDTYNARRRKEEDIKYIHPFLKPILDQTYGVPIYQEQVIAILRAIGFTSAEFNKMLKAIKASNERIIAAEATFRDMHKRFDDCCTTTGLTTKQTKQLWDMIATFSDYSFNRGHSTAYALLGYRMAYLKVHHPLEFHAALLQSAAGRKIEPIYIRETRRVGVRMMNADVNISGPNWTVDYGRNAIRRGLVSIPGIGVECAQHIADNGPYADVQEIIDSCEPRIVSGGKRWAKEGVLNGVLGALQQAGALKGVGANPSGD